MNRIKYLFLLGALSVLWAPEALGSKKTRAEEKPIITIYSDAYKEIGVENSFGIMLGSVSTDYFDIDCGFGLEEMEVEPWTVENGAIVGTYKSIRVSEEGVIKIYGDPSMIDMIQLQGGYVTSIEMDQCKNLEVLDLSHNALQKLDLTPFTNLYAIHLSDNPFTKETPLKVGAPKKRLAILEIDIIEHLDQSFNLSDYPSMQAFDAYYNRDLWNIDPTGCPGLLTMSLELTNVSSVDVSKNPKLMSLNISETRIKSIDLSNNPYLTTLMAEHASGTVNTEYYLEGIDLSNQPNLAILYLGGNRLSNVDISNNTALTNLNLKKNRLTSLDLSKNKSLYSVTLNYNDMDFATLPAPQDTWGEYFYLQNAMNVPKAIGVGQQLDLSSRVLRAGTETSAAVWVKAQDGNDTLLDGSLYSYKDGKVSFPQALPDSVYVKFANTLFSEYQLSTTPFSVKAIEDLGKPSPAVTLVAGITGGKALAASVGISGASEDNPKTFFADFGDGNLVEFKSASAALPLAPNLTCNLNEGSSLTIYTAEGDQLTALGIENFPLASIDLQKATALRDLKINKSGLTTIDLRFNRLLASLNLDSNNLSSLDLSGLYPIWEKHMLSNLSAANNQLENVTIVSTTPITDLNLSGNRISEFSLKNYDNIKVLNLSGNLLADELNLAYLGNAESIDLSGNSLSRVVYDSFENLKAFDISGNQFTIETLPYQPGAENYIYAPQQPIQILKNAPAINLSDQNRVLEDGVGTSFLWKKADGSALVEGTDYSCKDGATIFLDINLGKVYCEMSNPAFPQFTGDNILRTTEVNVVGAPTTIVASFTTVEDSENGEVIFTGKDATALYIDWRGDGSEYIPYDVATHYQVYQGVRTFKDANVKVYTYDSPEDITVFSTYGIKMKDFDGRPMTGLTALSVCNAGLTADKMMLPDANLYELKLIDNKLSEFPWIEKYPGLGVLDLNSNLFTEFDAGKLPSLQTLYLGDNLLTDIKFNNPLIWEIDLGHNKFDKIDFTGLKQPEQIWLSNNNLSEIDLKAFRGSLHSLDISNNRFTFATFPVPSDYPRLTGYYYGKQAKVDAEISDDFMTFDLSSQAVVNGAYETVYTWFLGEPSFDSDSGELSGETLIADDEYTIEDGVTTFNYKFSDDVVCVMTNSLFPKAYLQTPGYRVGYATAVDVVDGDQDKTVDVYTMSGMIVKRGVLSSEALTGLPKGIYIVGGKKFFVK